MRHFVTSFAPSHWEVYGRRFVDSFVRHCADPLYVFVDDYRGLPGQPYHPNVHWQALETFTASRLKQHDTADYRFQAGRFCQKVFAYSHPSLPKEGTRFWIDADVEIHNAIPEISASPYCYLGRKTWHHSECGFLGFDLGYPGVPEMIQRIAWYYRTGRVFALPEWHDSYVFDVVRREFDQIQGVNISYGIAGMHPWPLTILGRFAVHHKGPEAKARAYQL